MKRLLPAAFVSCFVAIPVFAALEPGDSAPLFELRASLAGEEFDFSLAEALEDGPVVVYFYPSAYTQGCNMQAHEFAVNMAEFEAAGASVVGVSLDSIERLNDFSADPEYCAGELPVASDPSGDVARSYGINVRDARPGALDSRGEEIGHGFADRITFIVTPDGKVSHMIGLVEGGRTLNPIDNVHQSLAAVQELAAR